MIDKMKLWRAVEEGHVRGKARVDCNGCGGEVALTLFLSSNYTMKYTFKEKINEMFEMVDDPIDG